ncbi:hypothetical protein D3C80_623580 [compost metagenome]
MKVADTLELVQKIANSGLQQAGIELALVQFYVKFCKRGGLVLVVTVVDEVFRVYQSFLPNSPITVLAQILVPGLLGIVRYRVCCIAGFQMRGQTVQVVLQAGDGMVGRGGLYLAGDPYVGQEVV